MEMSTYLMNMVMYTPLTVISLNIYTIYRKP